MSDHSPTPAPQPTAPACSHCWHQFGPASGSVTIVGGRMSGTNQCCHCGKTERYDYVLQAAPHIPHGPFLHAIEATPK